MKLSILLCLCLLAQGVFTHMPTVYEFCSHVVANGEGGRATCDASQCQGRPGKVGPVGSRGIQGLKGQKGENGTSEGLEEKVRILEESLKRVESEIETLINESLKRVESEMETSINESFTNVIASDPSMRATVCYMGMKSGHIPDSAITSSSDYDASYAVHLGRLDNQASGSNHGIWCAKLNRVGEWIQVDLGHSEVVAGVVTQGQSSLWVISYKVSCGITEGNMATITEDGGDKVFSANTDADTKVVNKFPQLMTCRYIRIYPQSYHTHTCMRLEIIRGICKDIY